MTTSSPGTTSKIGTVTRTVPDLGAARRFYAAALDMTADDAPAALSRAELDLLDAGAAQGWRQALRLGAQSLTLLGFDPPGDPYPADSRSSDLWFQHCAVVVADMERAHARVMAAGATPVSEGGPQRLPANTGGVTAFKFRDPFGHPMELLAFPAGVGDPSWHRPAAPLFMGIDHTAIAVSQAEASARFYREVLALRVVDRTRNQGTEQARLDAVAADDVDVVALQPDAAPPHLELLGYRTGSRRAAPMAAGTDAVASRTVLAGDVAAIEGRLHARGHAVRRGFWEGHPALSFQDPDGHRWICVAAP